MSREDIKFGPIGRIMGDHDSKLHQQFMQFYGKKIKSISVQSEWVKIEMQNGTALGFKSDEPDCCAHHYMHTDDDVTPYAGAKLLGAHIKYSTKNIKDDDSNVLESMFFDIITSKGTLTITSYNSHNGYYGGVGVNFQVLRSLQDKGVFR